MNDLPVVLNPVARGGRSHPPTEALERAAAAAGWRIVWWPTEGPGHATELARKAVRDGFPILAGWGGDGTYNELASGLAGSGTALLLLPGGTTSVLVYELGIPREPVQALLSQLAGGAREMTLGRTDRGQLFLLMLSVGPDALILQRLPSMLKRYAGKAGITAQAVVEFSRAHLPRFTVSFNGSSMEASWCIVGNGRSYGGPFWATPGADPFVRGLEAVVLTRHGRRAVVPFFFAIPSGRHLTMQGVTRVMTDRLVLTGDPAIPFQLDGDPAGSLPVAVEAADVGVRVLVPNP